MLIENIIIQAQESRQADIVIYVARARVKQNGQLFSAGAVSDNWREALSLAAENAWRLANNNAQAKPQAQRLLPQQPQQQPQQQPPQAQAQAHDLQPTDKQLFRLNEYAQKRGMPLENLVWEHCKKPLQELTRKEAGQLVGMYMTARG